MTEFSNKNDKQIHFNQIKGMIDELNDGEKYCNVTLKVGHENPRYVNLVCKKNEFDRITESHGLGDKVAIRFYLTSRKKQDKWYTTATILDVHKDVEKNN